MTKTTKQHISIFIAGLIFFFSGSAFYGQGHEIHPAQPPTAENFSKEDEGGEHEESIGDFIMHHVADAHDWHFTELKNADGSLTPIGFSLPWILYNSEKGFQFFGSSTSLNEDPNYIAHGNHVYYVKSKTPVFGVSEEEAKKDAAKYVMIGEGHHALIYEKAGSVFDFSITKTGLQIIIIGILLILVFRAVAKGYKRREGEAPKGIQSFFEPIVLFVRDEVARPFLHHKADKFLPLLLTLFFFIWFSNLMGLLPINSNIGGNISVTATLALVSFVLILANSTKDFWMHIFWFPGVPLPMKPLMLVVELMGFVTKPFSLAIRLFANISAGHFMTLSLVCLIFIMGNNGKSMAGALGVAPLSIAFSLFIFGLELLVGIVQAFVFTLLTAVFIGQAMETHSHDEKAHH